MVLIFVNEKQADKYFITGPIYDVSIVGEISLTMKFEPVRRNFFYLFIFNKIFKRYFLYFRDNSRNFFKSIMCLNCVAHTIRCIKNGYWMIEENLDD